MKNPVKSLLLVGVQFIAFILLFATGPVISGNIILLLFELIFMGVGFLGYWQMRKNHFNVVPDVNKKSRLMTNGIYRYIRNPMYLGIVGIGIVLIINRFSYFRVAVLFILLLDLIFKIKYEEELLEREFEDYSSYKKKTWRLIPFVY